MCTPPRDAGMPVGGRSALARQWHRRTPTPAPPAPHRSPSTEDTMSSAATPEFGSSMEVPATSEIESDIADFWWIGLIVGVAWIVAALVVLQFDAASITTIGIIIGLMFTFAGIEQLVLAVAADSLRWLWAIFGVLFLIAGAICFVNPKSTF